MTPSLDAGLLEVQVCVQKLEQELAQPSSAVSLQSVAEALHAQSFRLTAFVEQAGTATKKDAKWVRQLRQVVAALASCQSQLARRTAFNAQALQTLMPAARRDTYTDGLRNRAGQPYGSAGRQSGEFKVVSA